MLEAAIEALTCNLGRVGVDPGLDSLGHDIVKAHFSQDFIKVDFGIPGAGRMNLAWRSRTGCYCVDAYMVQCWLSFDLSSAHDETVKSKYVEGLEHD